MFYFLNLTNSNITLPANCSNE